MNVIVFSKDRACQLHACLESFYKYVNIPSKVTVLYKASNDAYEEGYKKCKESFKGTRFFSQVNFKQDLIRILDTIDQRVMFLVDDIIFTAPVDKHDEQLKLLQNPRILAVSLRLHSGITKCYATDENVEPPKLVKKMVWDWRRAKGDWGYPMSVDGNIYRWETIAPLVGRLQYTNPNTFEAALSQVAHDQVANMVCYPEGARLINIPANRVQNQFKNRYAQTAEASDLNRAYLSGQKIDIEEYAKEPYNTVHCPLDLVLKDAE